MNTIYIVTYSKYQYEDRYERAAFWCETEDEAKLAVEELRASFHRVDDKYQAWIATHPYPQSAATTEEDLERWEKSREQCIDDICEQEPAGVYMWRGDFNWHGAIDEPRFDYEAVEKRS